jgi:hypothetical protein
MPGTITASCRRTQAAVRNASATLPAALSALATGRGARRSRSRYHCSGMAAMPYWARTRSGPMHMASTTASG